MRGMAHSAQGRLQKIAQHTGWLVNAGVAISLAVMVLPLPDPVANALLVVDVSLALMAVILGRLRHA